LFDALVAERTAGTKEARDTLMARSADTLKSHAAGELEALQELRTEALKLPTPTDPLKAAARLQWMERVSALEKSVSYLQAVPGALTSGYQYATEIQRRSHTVAEHLAEANKLFVGSGLAEAIGGELAKAGGPLGVAAFEGSLLLLDHLVAEQGYWDRVHEENRAANNLNRMNRSLWDVEEKMANLVKDCPAQFGKDTGVEEPATASTSRTPPPPPKAEPPTEERIEVSAEEESGESAGKVALAAAGLGLAVGGAVYAGMALADLADETGGGTCASNRFCIVSVMSSGCSCSGSVSGGCDWTGPTANAGGSCGAGVPCVSGLSCNNGRCEGSSGRCRF
jgi:hypothetical protein